MPIASHAVSTQRGGARQASSRPSAAERAAQSARDKALHLQALRAGASLKSIPKGNPQKKQDLFTRGALRTPQFAPRGHGYYDAFAMTPDSACVSATTGPATVISGYSSDTIAGGPNVSGNYAVAGTGGTLSTSHTGNAILILFNPGSSNDVIAKVMSLTAGTGGNLEVITRHIAASQFAELGPVQASATTDANHVDGDPATADTRPTRRVESIPLRGSVRIRNVTEALSVGGTVRALRYNGGITLASDEPGGGDALAPDPAMFLQLCAMIRDSPRTRIYNGDELRRSHQSNTYPSDFVRSMAFEQDTSFDEAVRRPGYCTLMILVDDFTASNTLTNNSYELTFMVQRAARFGMGTILGGMARTLRVRPLHAEHAADEARPPLMLTM